MFVCDCSFTDQKWYRSSLPTSRQSAITYRGQAATSNNQTRKYGRRVDFSLDDMIRDTSEADFSLDDYIRDTSEVISLWTVSSEIHRKGIAHCMPTNVHASINASTRNRASRCIQQGTHYAKTMLPEAL